MATNQTTQSYIQSSIAGLIRNTSSKRDKLKRLIIHEQKLLSEASGSAIEYYNTSIAKNETARDIEIENLKVLERGFKNTTVGVVCLGKKGIEYFIEHIHQKFIQGGATEERTTEAKLQILEKIGKIALSFPQDMREEVESSIAEQLLVIG